MTFNPKVFKKDFPLLNEQIIYLDNASTTQKPNKVIDSVIKFYKDSNANLPATQYNKPYYVSNFFKRNKQIAEYSNIIVAFIPDGVESRGTMDTVGHAEKLKKLVKIIN